MGAGLRPLRRGTCNRVTTSGGCLRTDFWLCKPHASRGRTIPIIQGRLITAISQATGKLALLIVDETDREVGGKKLWSGPRTAQNRVARDKIRMAQLEVISACEQKGAAMINISFAYGLANQASEPDVTPANNLAIEFRKGEANAFQMPSSGGDSLQDQLKRAGVETLVVMGYHVNACVRATIGVDKFLQSVIDSDKTYWGAIQYRLSGDDLQAGPPWAGNQRRGA